MFKLCIRVNILKTEDAILTGVTEHRKTEADVKREFVWEEESERGEKISVRVCRRLIMHAIWHLSCRTHLIKNCCCSSSHNLVTLMHAQLNIFITNQYAHHCMNDGHLFIQHYRSMDQTVKLQVWQRRKSTVQWKVRNIWRSCEIVKLRRGNLACWSGIK